MKDKYKLGVIGLSEGNGHPYSWSAIFNGYNASFMNDCGFPVIPEYLSKQKFPESTIKNAIVTHVWTQDLSISRHIANATNILHVCESLEEMIGQIDAVLLARDDAENHLKMARPFLENGLPIFIDKPLAFSLSSMEDLIDLQQYDGQIFTCSSLRYSNELYLTDDEKNKIGNIDFIQAQISKSWDKYAIHLIEPIIAGNPLRGRLRNIKVIKKDQITKVIVIWENFEAEIGTFGPYIVPLNINYFGRKTNIVKSFSDTYNTFKKSLMAFVSSFCREQIPIPRNETREIIQIIEEVRNA